MITCNNFAKETPPEHAIAYAYGRGVQAGEPVCFEYHGERMYLDPKYQSLSSAIRAFLGSRVGAKGGGFTHILMAEGQSFSYGGRCYRAEGGRMVDVGEWPPTRRKGGDRRKECGQTKQPRGI